MKWVGQKEELNRNRTPHGAYVHNFPILFHFLCTILLLLLFFLSLFSFRDWPTEFIINGTMLAVFAAPNSYSNEMANSIYNNYCVCAYQNSF